MLYKCIFLYFLFIVKRYDGDNKLLCSGSKTKKSRLACCRSGLVLFVHSAAR